MEAPLSSCMERGDPSLSPSLCRDSVLGAGNHGFKALSVSLEDLPVWRSREAFLAPAGLLGFLLVLDMVPVHFGPAQLGDVGWRFNGI